MDLLLRLLVAHALCDYVLQPEFMARHKSPLADENPKLGPWWWTMLAHGLVNGGGVYWATGLWTLGVAETVVHGVTDYLKCTGKIGTWADQLIHLGSKLVWLFLCLR